jgi:hypothetical protein
MNAKPISTYLFDGRWPNGPVSGLSSAGTNSLVLIFRLKATAVRASIENGECLHDFEPWWATTGEDSNRARRGARLHLKATVQNRTLPPTLEDAAARELSP